VPLPLQRSQFRLKLRWKPPSADPALAAIAKHRQASSDHLSSIYAVDDTHPRTDERYDAEDHNEACCVAAMDAAWDLARLIHDCRAGQLEHFRSG